jgi:hypothetical protein
LDSQTGKLNLQNFKSNVQIKPLLQLQFIQFAKPIHKNKLHFHFSAAERFLISVPLFDLYNLPLQFSAKLILALHEIELHFMQS